MLRPSIIDRIWSGNGLPSSGAESVNTGVASPLTTDSSNLLRVDHYTINMDDNNTNFVMASQPYLFRPTTGNGKLTIVHPGHTTSFEVDGVGNTIRALIDDGFAVVSMLMPGNGSVSTHNTYPQQNSSLNYLKFFIEPVVRMINELEGSYSDIYMTGLSGGAWTTVLASAIDTRITRSVQVSGTLPYYSLSNNDWEQQLPGLHPSIGYIDLYFLAADSVGRRQVQTLTVSDVIFNLAQYNAGTDYEDIVPLMAAEYGGSWELIWDNTNSDHSISAYELTVIRSEFNA